MTVGNVLVIIWMCWIACVTLFIAFRAEATRRQTAQNYYGLNVVFSIIMHLLKHECEESYDHLKMKIALDALEKEFEPEDQCTGPHYCAEAQKYRNYCRESCRRCSGENVQTCYARHDGRKKTK